MAKTDLFHKLNALADLPKGVGVFVACSGGRDSLSLAFACHQLYQMGKLPALPVLLHVHHGIQKANDLWAKKVAAWAKDLGFVCHVLYVQLDKPSETAARAARYQALASVMNDEDVLLLGHHAHDQAETVLMRWVNGAGVQGLSGMKTWQSKRIGQKTIRLYRPWLLVERDDITKFAHQHHLPFVDDPTNDTGDNVRSFIRTQILPKLAHINPQAIPNIARSCENLADVAHFVKQNTSVKLTDCVVVDDLFQRVLDIGRLDYQDKAGCFFLIRQWLQGTEKLPPNKRITDDIWALSQRQDGDHHTQIVWQIAKPKQGYVVCRYGRYLYRYPLGLWQSLQSPSLGVAHQTNGRWLLGSLGKTSVLIDGEFLQVVPLTRLDKVPVKVGNTLRQLSGKKLYQTLKIPTWLRSLLWLVTYQDGQMALVSLYHTWSLQDVPKLSFVGAYVQQ